MKRRRSLRLFLGALLLLPGAPFAIAQEAGLDERRGLEGCTIGVATGRVTADGRPLLWKTRDAEAPDNEVRWATATPFSFLGVFNASGTSPWMGVNERGFALVNANSLDLPGAGNSGNGAFMRRALAECATVADFEQLLESTNEVGRRTQAHFAAIDTTGAAVLFETAGFQYWKFDAEESDSGAGSVLRTNFALNGGGSTGLLRYRRSQAIIGDLRSAGTLSARTVITAQMRDFADAGGNPYPIPYPHRSFEGVPFGYVPTGFSICGATSVSAAVLQGVLPGEPAMLTTMWTLLGLPAAAVAVPYWPAGPTPHPAHGNPTAPLCDEARRLHAGLYWFSGGPGGGGQEYLDSYALRDGNGKGLWNRLLPAEEWIAMRAEEWIARWRTEGRVPASRELLDVEEELASYAWTVLRSLRMPHEEPDAGIPARNELAQNYPNPFNTSTLIRFSVARQVHATLQIYDMLGRSVAVLLDRECPPGTHDVRLDGGGLATGVYWCRLTAGDFTASRPLVLLR